MMTAAIPRLGEPCLLTAGDVEAARAAGQVLASLEAGDGVRVGPSERGEGGHGAVLPGPVVHLLRELLAVLAQGRPAVVMPGDVELTTQQAADLLNVSRPYVVKLVEGGALPHRKVGTHRRIPLPDLLEYRRIRKVASQAALAELVQQAQELDMGY